MDRVFALIAKSPLVLALCTLSACGGMDRLSLGFGKTPPPPETVAVAGRSVVIGGPQGYCVDEGASRLTGERPFVLLGSCASITGDRNASAPARLGVLTAVVSPPGGPSFGETLSQLDAFFASDAGKSALARDGNAASVELFSTEVRNGAMVIHLSDTSANIVPGIATEYRRALFEVNGRLVTVSVMSFEDRPMDAAASAAALNAFIARVRRESGAV